MEDLTMKEFQLLGRTLIRLVMSAFNKLNKIRLDKLRPAKLKDAEYRAITIKPTHSDIFGGQFIEQLTEAQKEAKVYRAISSKPEKKSTQANRGRGQNKGYRGRKGSRGQSRAPRYSPYPAQQGFQQQQSWPAPQQAQFVPQYNQFGPPGYSAPPAYPASQQSAAGPQRGRGCGRGNSKPKALLWRARSSLHKINKVELQMRHWICKFKTSNWHKQILRCE